MHWFALLLWSATQAPPAPGAPSPTASAWSCTRATLRSDQPCALDGSSAAQPPSAARAQENARNAAALLREACGAIVAGAPDASALAVCAQAERGLASVCDGSTTPLVDDAGRFNPGHGRCYAALRGALEDARALMEDGAACCACAVSACGAAGATCRARIADRKPLDGACAATCAQPCAAARARALLAPPASASRSPAANAKPAAATTGVTP